MEILVRDRDTILDIDPDVPYVVISMTSVDGNWPDIPENQYCRGVLRLLFQDIDIPQDVDPEELLRRLPNLVPFSSEMAKHVLGFMNKHHTVDLVICQCDFGISRSSAIAAALGKIYLNDDSFIFSDITYVPNRHVYTTLMQTYGNDKVTETAAKTTGGSSSPK
jgi:hypothetical protein